MFQMACCITMVRRLELVQAQFVQLTSEMADGGLRVRADCALIVVIDPSLEEETNLKREAERAIERK